METLTSYGSDGTPLERASYDSWGERRDHLNASLPDLPHYNPGYTTKFARGYTSHEHADAFGLIHMNGRVYDGTLGRFLQADPFVQSPGDLQSYNRYSYVLNNPLAYTDPSGYFSFRKVVDAIANGIFGEALANQFPILRPIFQIAACASGNVYVCAGSAFGNTYAAGGSFKESLKSGGFCAVAAAVVLCSLSSACLAVGDGALRVKGVITNVKGDRQEGCKLELRRAKDDFVADWQEVPSEFLQTFTITPGGNRYRFVVLCDAVGIYRSPDFNVGGMDRYRDPIDLGVIRVEEPK